MINRIKTYAPIAYSLVAAAVFLDSLRFMFTNAIETQVIFGRLDAWAASFGAKGLFAQTGLFSQYVIGTAELAASTLLLLGLCVALTIAALWPLALHLQQPEFLGLWLRNEWQWITGPMLRPELST